MLLARFCAMVAQCQRWSWRLPGQPAGAITYFLDSVSGSNELEIVRTKRSLPVLNDQLCM
jgi:hypothetical protein